MDPQQTGEALRLTVDFTPQMDIDAGESVVLTLPMGFSGPRAESREMNPESMQPANAFVVFWSFPDAITSNGTVTESQATITFTVLAEPGRGGTRCRVVLPSTCVFLEDLKCASPPPIVRATPSDFDPLELTLGSDARAGPVPPTPVRLSSVLAASAVGSFNGSWAGDFYSNVAALAEATRSHLYSCLSVAYQCPSMSGYRCFSVVLPAQLDVVGDRARLEVEPQEQLLPDLNKAFHLGRLSASLALDDFSKNHLRSVTARRPLESMPSLAPWRPGPAAL